MMDKLTLELKEVIKDLREMGYTDDEILAACRRALGLEEEVTR